MDYGRTLMQHILVGLTAFSLAVCPGCTQDHSKRQQATSSTEASQAAQNPSGDSMILKENSITRREGYEISVSSVSSDSAVVWFTADGETKAINMSVGQTEKIGQYSISLIATNVDNNSSDTDAPNPGSSSTTANVRVSK